MQNRITANQRDSMEALKWSAITGGFIFIMAYLFLIGLETVIFNALKIIDTDADIKQLFGIYLSHASHFSFLKMFGVGASLNSLNEAFKDNQVIIISEYVIYILAMIPAVLMFQGEYKNMMVNEKFIKGVKYFSDFSAQSELEKYIKKVSGNKKGGDGVPVAGVKITRDLETKHLAITGKTGGGKTVAIWNILVTAINRGDLVIMFDNKGDFTRKLLDMFGLMPCLIAPWDARSYSWHIARDVRSKADAAELATSFIAESSDPMWSDAARQILTGLIHKLQCDKHEGWTWGDLAELLYVDMNEVEELMEKYHREGKRAVESIKNAMGESEGAGKTTQSILITMSAQLSPVYRLAEAWADVDGQPKERFSIRDFLDGKLKSNVVILQGNKSLSNLQNACVLGVIAMLSNRINSPAYAERKPHEKGLWIFLDEFAQIGKVKVEDMLAIGRSKGVRVVMGWQNMSQLYDIYGKDAATAMLDIFGSYVFCSLGPDASGWASEAIGSQKIERFKTSTSINNGTASTSNSWESSEEAAVKPVDLTEGLGVDLPAGGCWSIFWPVGGGVFKLLFKFNSAKDVREGHEPASWLNPAWVLDNSEDAVEIDIDVKDIDEKVFVVNKNFALFIAKHAESLLGVGDFKSSVVDLEKQPGADFEAAHEAEEETSDMEDDFDFSPVHDD